METYSEEDKMETSYSEEEFNAMKKKLGNLLNNF